jgi:hypothetical protein
MECTQLFVVIIHKWAWDQLGKINGLLVPKNEKQKPNWIVAYKWNQVNEGELSKLLGTPFG